MRPAQVTGLQAVGGRNQVTLSWTSPNNRSIDRFSYQQEGQDWTAIPRQQCLHHFLRRARFDERPRSTASASLP